MVEYVGLDVSKEETAFCVKSETGEVLARGKVATAPEAVFEALREHCLDPARIVLETGTQTAWLARGLRRYGLPVEVVDAREAHALLRLQRNKTDASDAELLAEIARLGFARPVAVKSEAAQRQRILLEARAHLVGQRVATQNTIRGLLRSLGIGFPKGTGKLALRVGAVLAERPELRATIEPLLSVAEVLGREIERFDQAVRDLVEDDPDCRLLMTAPGVGPGVGPVTALAYAATIDDPHRFRHSRSVGAYLGLTTRRHQSGAVDYSGRISKRGDGLLRALLYEAANSFLCAVRRPHPLKDWARKIKRKVGHKKARVALARKLAVILHRMWLDGEAFRWPPAAPARAPA